MKKNFKVKVITIFPESFPGILKIGVIGKALKNKIWSLKTINPRDFSKGVHKSVDDTTAGGGPGMILKADIVGKAINSAYKNVKDRKKIPLIYLSPRGKPLTQNKINQLSKKDGMILLCGRYEGIDERISEHYKVDEYSIGDFILAGGEIAAQALIESTVRLLSGTLGHKDSSKEESFNSYLLEFPQYTRPKVWNNLEIPEVLLSGDHKKIAFWRKDMAEKLTKKIRPDLWKKYKKNKTIKK